MKTEFFDRERMFGIKTHLTCRGFKNPWPVINQKEVGLWIESDWLDGTYIILD